MCGGACGFHHVEKEAEKKVVTGTEPIPCSNKSCKGNFSPATSESSVTIRIHCHTFDSAFPCVECGRLHFADGNPVMSRHEKPQYLHLEQNVVHKTACGRTTKRDSLNAMYKMIGLRA